MVKIAICDDSKFMRGEIKKRILEYSMKKDFDYTLNEYDAGEKLIGSGEKKEEYRAITPYWTRRILTEEGQARHDRVIFYFGYAKNRPSMTFSIDGVCIGQGKSEWGAELGKEYIVIRLGKRVN